MRHASFFSAMLLCLMSLPVSAASPNITTNAPYLLSFQIVQDQLVLDITTVKNAWLHKREDGTYISLIVELKDAAAKTLEQMTDINVGRSMNLVMNNKIINTTVIQGALGKELQITGISKEEAMEFMTSLRNTQITAQKEAERKAAELREQQLKEAEQRTTQVSA